MFFMIDVQYRTIYQCIERITKTLDTPSLDLI